MKRRITNPYGSTSGASKTFREGFNAGVNHCERWTKRDEEGNLKLPDPGETCVFGYWRCDKKKEFYIGSYIDGCWQSSTRPPSPLLEVEFWRYLSCDRELIEKTPEQVAAERAELDAMEKETGLGRDGLPLKQRPADEPYFDPDEDALEEEVEIE